MFSCLSAPGAGVLIDVLDDGFVELLLELKLLLEPVYSSVALVDGGLERFYGWLWHGGFVSWGGRGVKNEDPFLPRQH